MLNQPTVFKWVCGPLALTILLDARVFTPPHALASPEVPLIESTRSLAKIGNFSWPLFHCGTAPSASAPTFWTTWSQSNAFFLSHLNTLDEQGLAIGPVNLENDSSAFSINMCQSLWNPILRRKKWCFAIRPAHPLIWWKLHYIDLKSEGWQADSRLNLQTSRNSNGTEEQNARWSCKIGEPYLFLKAHMFISTWKYDINDIPIFSKTPLVEWVAQNQCEMTSSWILMSSLPIWLIMKLWQQHNRFVPPSA